MWHIIPKWSFEGSGCCKFHHIHCVDHMLFCLRGVSIPAFKRCQECLKIYSILEMINYTRNNKYKSSMRDDYVGSVHLRDLALPGEHCCDNAQGHARTISPWDVWDAHARVHCHNNAWQTGLNPDYNMVAQFWTCFSTVFGPAFDICRTSSSLLDWQIFYTKNILNFK